MRMMMSRRNRIEDGYGESPQPLPLRGAFVAKRGGKAMHVWPIIDIKLTRLWLKSKGPLRPSWGCLGAFGGTYWAV